VDVEMKRLLPAIIIPILLASCAPVLSPEVMDRGRYDPDFDELVSNPDAYRGTFYILGGIIAKTRATAGGSIIEALYVPVNNWGYLKGYRLAGGRFLALYRGSKILDPMIFRKNREITIAGEFIGTRTGKIDDADYTYPLFEIREFYLWEEPEKREYYYPPPYYSPPPYYRYRDNYPRWWYY
jgi:outer membrane lipoprotein